jgi:hypothetical protein
MVVICRDSRFSRGAKKDLFLRNLSMRSIFSFRLNKLFLGFFLFWKTVRRRFRGKYAVLGSELLPVILGTPLHQKNYFRVSLGDFQRVLGLRAWFWLFLGDAFPKRSRPAGGTYFKQAARLSVDTVYMYSILVKTWPGCKNKIGFRGIGSPSRCATRSWETEKCFRGQKFCVFRGALH